MSSPSVFWRVLVFVLVAWLSACVEPNDSLIDPPIGDAAVTADVESDPTIDAFMGRADGGVIEPDAEIVSVPVVLNEVQCRDTEWIELINTGSVPAVLDGWVLSDNDTVDEDDLLLTGVSIEPGQFWVTEQLGELPFGVGCESDSVYLINERAEIVSEVDVGDPLRGLSWGRLPDGEGEWQNTRPTPGAANEPPTTRVFKLNEIDCRGRDRVEIINLTGEPADLRGWTLTDDLEDENDGYGLRGFADEGEFVTIRQQTQEDSGFTFGVACDGETISLLRPDGTVEDQIEMRALPEAYNLGRLPDGDGEWASTTPTIGEPNKPPAADDAAPFGADEVLEIDLTVDEDALQGLRDEPREYVPAVFEVRGVTEDPLQVGLRIKGRIGSLRGLDDKPAWKIKFDFLDNDQRFMKLERMTLNNMVQDPSQVHEWAAYRLFRAQGLPAPRVGAAFVRLNGEIYGVYAIIETPDENMLARWFAGTRYSYEGAYGQDLIGNRIHELELDQGPSSDRAHMYTLQQMLDQLDGDAFFNETAELINWPAVIGTMATEIYIGHWDGYAPTRNNYYFHFDESEALSLLPWGTDQTFDRELDFYGGRGRIFEACRESGPCRFAFEEALVQVMETVDALEFPMGIQARADLLLPWQELDDRSNRNPNQIAGRVQRTIDFLARRAEGARETLQCLLGDNPDPDNDGFLCSADCDNNDATIFPGAPEVCEDGIDQDCNGRVDDGEDCPDCVNLMAGDHRYLVCTDRRTYAEAAAHCADQGAELVSIESAAENNWVRRMARRIHPQDFWLGANDIEEEGSYVWPTGRSLEAYDNWVGNEPNGRENENCIQLRVNGGAWIDVNCAGRLSVLCEDACPDEAEDRDGDGFAACRGDCNDGDASISPEAAERCYDGVDNNCNGNIDESPDCVCTVRRRGEQLYLFCNAETLNWNNARRFCEEQNTRLLVIEDAEENQWVIDQFRATGQRNSWIGLNDSQEEGTFRWIDGTPLEYTRWNQGEPNDWRGGEDCGQFLDNGRWNDAQCGNRNAFICERPAGPEIIP